MIRCDVKRVSVSALCCNGFANRGRSIHLQTVVRAICKNSSDASNRRLVSRAQRSSRFLRGASCAISCRLDIYTGNRVKKKRRRTRCRRQETRARARFRPRSPANVSGKTMNRVGAAHMRANARHDVDESREHEQMRFSLLFVRIVTPEFVPPLPLAVTRTIFERGLKTENSKN